MHLDAVLPKDPELTRGTTVPCKACHTLSAQSHLTFDSPKPSLKPSCSLSIQAKALPFLHCLFSVDDPHSVPLPQRVPLACRMLGAPRKPEPVEPRGQNNKGFRSQVQRTSWGYNLERQRLPSTAGQPCQKDADHGRRGSPLFFLPHSSACR